MRDVAQRRLQNERLVGRPFATPEEAVEWFGAVQSQDYGGAKWALGQRTRDATDPLIERALERGTIVRTHVLRPTWHFVRPADLRWMLALSAPRIQANSAHRHRELEIDASLLRRTNAAIARALEGGAHLTRAEIERVLKKARITATGPRLAHLLMHAELEAVITSGAWRGKQATYAAFDARVPAAKALSREAALEALALRYFQSHGPARVRDFAWWAGLTAGDAQRGIARCGAQLEEEDVEGQRYFSTVTRLAKRSTRPSDPVVHLLPNYDEYLVAYQDRSHALDPLHAGQLGRELLVANNVVLVNGRVVGSWRRSIEKKAIVVEAKVILALERKVRAVLEDAVSSYGRFIQAAARLRVQTVDKA
jgi:hypothetical protein